jgi:hypothetical protein
MGCFMQLWTWQSKDFSLADESQKVESIKHSCYLTKNPDPNSKEKHQEAYNKIFQILGTDQLIWCFPINRDAVDYRSIEEFVKNQHCLLWELDIPENEIKWYCESAWHSLRTGKPVMPEDDFNSFWSCKTEDELLDLMFLKKPVLDLGLPNAHTPGCSGAIVIHPVGKDKIKKNPLEIGKWWESSNKRVFCSSFNKDKNLLKKIPCHHCPGR